MRQSIASLLGAMPRAGPRLSEPSAIWLAAALVAAAFLLVVLPGAAAARAGGAAQCDPLDAASCLLPWPNDRFTRRDRSTPTGRRLALDRAAMPRNAAGTPIDPRPFNRADGFSPGQTIVTRVPGLDTAAALRRSGVVTQSDMGRAFARRAPVVVIAARSGRRQLIWAELDASAARRRDVTLLVHPGVNFREGERYIVALRNLRDARGRRLRARRGFRLLRDRIRTRSRAIERRRAHMESIFRSLRRAGIARRELYLAWDFTVASRRSLAARLLSIRDRAFAALGDRNLRDLRPSGRAPRFTVDSVTLPTPAEDPYIARRVEGRFYVPCFLDRRGCPTGSRFRLDRRGLPVRLRGDVQEARYVCLVPRTLSAAAPGRPLLYGHGLFGGRDEITRGRHPSAAAESRNVTCATDWYGMAREDVFTALSLARDLSRFPALADRVQQGMLAFLYLGRLMVHPRGFAAQAAFRDGGRPLIDTRRLFFAGGSQGGILGGALTAVAPDFTRSALLVPAINFSVLLQRALPFRAFAAVLYPSYPRPLDRQLTLSLIQLLWDRGEGNGYAQHMTDRPYPNTPRHTVLLHEAFGDHQVANVQTEVEARTIGARLRAPALDRGRSNARRPFHAIPRVPRYPWARSALVAWDIGPLRAGGLGTPAPPLANLVPDRGVDPHTLTAAEPAAVRQLSRFLRLDGAFVDVCGRRPCYAAGWRGP